jgi:serine/threonine-protein kinase
LIRVEEKMEVNSNDKYIGKRLDGRYEIVSHIGEGGMADVYMATDVLDHKKVAVKILKKEFSENEEFLRRFRNESKAIAVLSHPNIVKVYDVGFTDKIQFIVMEYIDGITLREYIDSQEVLTWKDSVHFIIQILRALQHAHNRGIVHRDIKPQNIMLFTDGTIKVMDFGIAKFARDQSRTATDQAIGTVHYISPEQARGDVTDEKSDIYSVGVMLYEMLTGVKPFDTDNPVSIAVMHMQTQAKRPRSINPAIPVGLEEIILKAMEKNAQDRYHTASDMIRDLERFKENPAIIFGYTPSQVNHVRTERSYSNRGSYNNGNSYPSGSFSRNDSDEAVRRQRTSVREYQKGRNDYIEEDNEEQEESNRSLFVPVLMAVTIVVVIVAIFFVASLFQKVLRGEGINSMIEMKNLVGMDYDEAKNAYPDLVFNIAETDYTTYDENIIYEQDIQAGEMIKSGETVNVGVSLGISTVKIQDVTNWDYKTAKTTIESQGLVVEIRYATSSEIDKDKVIESSPEAESEVVLNSKVILYVSKGLSSEPVKVSNYVGMTIEKAESEARYLGLTVKKEAVDSDMEENMVVSQSIDEGEEVDAGTEIVFEYSNGKSTETTEASGTITYQMPIPTNASGRFTLDFTIDGITVKSVDFNASSGTGSISPTIEGSGTKSVVVILTNNSNNSYKTIGTYSFDFTNKTFSTVSEDITGAFEAVDGIKVETQAPETTQEATTVAQDVVDDDNNYVDDQVDDNAEN